MRALTLFSVTLAGVAAVAAPPAAVEDGRDLYVQYCASCHGLDGTGSGPVAPYLRTPPADLTRLAERHGWPLPRAELAEWIDGRRAARAHGTREMPVWGERLDETFPPPPEGEAEKARKIDRILDYLETLQVGVDG